MIDPRHSLELLGPEQTLLRERIARLTSADLERPSNLTDWRVADVAVHITRVTDSILLAIKRSTYGDTTPAFGPAAKPREDEIRAMGPMDWAELIGRNIGEITALVNGFSDPQLDAFTFPHPQGVRPVRWYCTQLLAETSYHRWDLQTSLGARSALAPELAAYLLPFLLDPDRPLFAGKKSPDGDTHVFCLSTGSQHWSLTCTTEGTVVRTLSLPEGNIVQAAPEILALALYGRIAVQGSGFVCTGDTGSRFSALFGPS